MHENEISLHENKMFMHENENFAQNCSWVKITCMKLCTARQPIKISGAKKMFPPKEMRQKEVCVPNTLDRSAIAADPISAFIVTGIFYQRRQWVNPFVLSVFMDIITI